MSIEYSIVIPVYNSGEWLPELTSRISSVMSEHEFTSYEVILVNDCSPNKDVWPVIKELSSKDSKIKGIDFQFNRGQFVATSCGLAHAKGKYVITMDDDLQHLPEELPTLINGIVSQDKDCVFGIYENTQQKEYRKLGSRFANYFMGKLYGRPKNIKNSSFRIMTNTLAMTVSSYKTRKPHISPIIFLCTKSVGNVTVTHNEREYGTSGYNLKSLIKETFSVVLNTSTLPLDIVSGLGFVSSITAALVGLVYLIKYLTGDINVAGFTTQILITIFFGGLILFSIGILGKYVERIIKEITGLPEYVIAESTNFIKEEEQ